MEAKGLKINVEKTKVMRSGKGGGGIEKIGKWPCAVCGKGVGIYTYIYIYGCRSELYPMH